MLSSYAQTRNIPSRAAICSVVSPPWVRFSPESEPPDGSFTVTAGGADADKLLATLLPGLDAEAESLSVELITDGQQLEQIRFRGELSQEGEISRITATLTVLGTEPTVAIPDAVQASILAGRLEAAENLTDDLLRLIRAWSQLGGTNAIGATLTLAADCGSLKLQDDLTLYRRGSISAIEKFGRILYFTDSAICDKNGNSLSVAEADAVQTGKLLDLAWQLCMEGQLTVSHAGPVHSYALALDEEGMAAVSQAIASQSASMDIGFLSGSIILELRGDRLERMSLAVSGEMDALLVKIPASLSATFDIFEAVDFQIPQAVQNALG